ncbi:MAG: hypothetical protein HZB99_00740 [Candidatus Harrisonbacteria bacterium]|nr:hypothetical protein [Candidatus Harrisonbacteria bacterium]
MVRRAVFPLLAVALLAACDAAKDPNNIKKSGCTPLDYGNGVYYFPCIEANFANALSTFLKNFPMMEVSAMTGNGNGSYGHNMGYFVVVRKSK